jgi:hypothetical protein
MCDSAHKAGMLMRIFRSSFIAFLMVLTAPVLAADNPFIGDWALKLPGGAGWLGVQEANGQLEASIMWIAGSVEPVTSAKLEDGKLVLTRDRTVRRRVDGKSERVTRTETIRATVDGDTIHCTSTRQRDDGQGEDTNEFSGKRQPPVPPAPDLEHVKYGAPVELFNGKDLSGWRLTDSHAVNGWSVKDGILVNNPAQEEGKPHKPYGNLRTDRVFDDFNLHVEVRPSKGENSGVYVRGIYEIQVMDSYGKPTDSHNMGAVYSRIKPTVSAEKPPGEWQTLDITFVERHMTIVLNGTKIIDNQPVHGCTGGALFSDVTQPGPIYLQGDHTGIEYRKLTLRPVQK